MVSQQCAGSTCRYPYATFAPKIPFSPSPPQSYVVAKMKYAVENNMSNTKISKSTDMSRKIPRF